MNLKNVKELEERRRELIKKADAAQERGDYETMDYYDRQKSALDEMWFEELKRVYGQAERVWIVPDNDLEAHTIIEMLEENGETVLVTGQAWGASWENLENDIQEKVEEAKKNGKKVYGVELQGDSKGGINIDHHIYGNDDRSSDKASIEQVAMIIKRVLSIEEKFIAANDKGYIPAMIKVGKKLGLSDEQINEVIKNIRLRDREMQGVTMEQEEEAETAVEELGVIEGKREYIHLNLPHSKTSTVTDRLFGKYENLLVISADGETNFYGTTQIIKVLEKKFPGGWSGGQLEQGTGFWGGYADQKQIQETVETIVKENSKVKEILSYMLGSDLHEAWRAPRLKPDGTYEPRMKKSKDEKWNKIHGTDDVDIANTSFEDLPENWQYENLEAARTAIGLCFDKIVSDVEITNEMIEELSSKVHEAWLTRNTWVFDENYGDKVLSQSYEALPEEEKAKDRVQIKQAIAMIKKYTGGELSLESIAEKFGLNPEVR